MKIIIVNYRFFLSGGPEKYLFNFIKAGQSRGHTIIPFSVNYSNNINEGFNTKYFINSKMGNSSSYSNFSKNIFSQLLFIINSIFNFEARKMMKRIIKEEKPDLVYVIHQSLTISPSFFYTVKKHKIKLVHRISDFNMICSNNLLLRDGKPCEKCINGNYSFGVKHKCVKNSFSLSFIKALINYIHRLSGVYNLVDAFIFPSKHTLEVFSRSNYISKKKLFYLPTFSPAKSIHSTITDTILIPGRLSFEKGYIVALKAMIELNKRNIYINLTFNGNIDDLDLESLDLINSNGLKNQLRFSGFIDQINYEKILSSSLLVLFPALWYENLPNTLIESYKFSKPVISSNIGSLREFVKEGFNGYLFEPNNHIELADKIQHFLENQNNLHFMGKNSYRVFLENFQEEDHWNNFMNIIDGINLK